MIVREAFPPDFSSSMIEPLTFEYVPSTFEPHPMVVRLAQAIMTARSALRKNGLFMRRLLSTSLNGDRDVADLLFNKNSVNTFWAGISDSKLHLCARPYAGRPLLSSASRHATDRIRAVRRRICGGSVCDGPCPPPRWQV